MSDDPPVRDAGQPASTANRRVALADPEWDRPAATGHTASPAPQRPASVGKRAGAYIIDYLAVNVVLVIVGVRSGFIPVTAETMTEDQAYLAGVIASGVALLYFVVLEAAFGVTLAKRLLGIRVVMANGGRVTVRAAFTRRVLFFAGMLVPLVGSLFNFAVPLAALITSIQDEPTTRGFHDRWAGTVVIEADTDQPGSVAGSRSPNKASR